MKPLLLIPLLIAAIGVMGGCGDKYEPRIDASVDTFNGLGYSQPKVNETIQTPLYCTDSGVVIRVSTYTERDTFFYYSNIKRTK